jgi:DNA-binding CsgD family transcriptional regulator
VTWGPGQHRLLERDFELDRIGRALECAAQGEGATLLLEGPAGVGKTELLNYAAARARERRFTVLYARGHHLEKVFPYGVVRQLLERTLISAAQGRSDLLDGSAGAALSVIGDSSPKRTAAHSEEAEEVSYSTLHGLYWFCANLAEGAPVMIGVDDLQWTDLASQRFLLYLARRLDSVPLVLALTYRGGEGSDELRDELASEPATDLIRPKPLGPQAVSTFLGDWFSQEPADSFVSSCLRATGGNPFLLRELLQSLEQRGLRPTEGNAEAVPQMQLPGVSKSVTRRLRQLPAPDVEVARALALFGSASPLLEVAELARVSPSDTAEAVDRLLAIDVFKPGEALDFAHPVVAAAVYDDIPLAKRRRQHGLAAELLGGRGAPIDRIAAQILPAEPVGDGRRVDMLRRAGAQALGRGAPGSTVTYLRRALAEPPSDADRRTVLSELGAAEIGVDPPAAVEHLSEALDLSTDPRERAYVCLNLLRALLAVGNVEAGIGYVKACVAALGKDDADLAMLLEAELISVLRQGLAASPLTDQAFQRWKDRLTGRTAAERLLLTHLAAHTALKGGSAEKVARISEQALGDGQLLADQSSGSSLFYLPIYQLLCADRFHTAEAQLELAAQDARKRGSPLGFAMVSMMRSCLAYARGNLRDAEIEAGKALSDADRLGWAYGLPTALGVMVTVLADQGRLGEAEGLVKRYRADDYLPETVPYRLLLAGRGGLRLAQSRDQEAVDDFTDLMRREEERGASNLYLTPYRSAAAVALHRMGQQETAGALIEESLAAARRWAAPRILALTLRHAALVKSSEHGLELLAEAVKVIQPSDARLVRAECLVDYGATLRRLGKRTASVPLLREGLDLAYRCHAHPLVQKARDELKILGSRPRRAVISGVDSLTASERRVAQLAAEGMSNRAIAQALFVTNRTVEVHLTHAYQKLGIGSRDQLPAMIAPAAGMADRAAH